MDVHLEQSTYIWQDQLATVHFSMAVTNVAVNDVMSNDEAPMQVFAALSEDLTFHPLLDTDLGGVTIPTGQFQLHHVGDRSLGFMILNKLQCVNAFDSPLVVIVQLCGM